MHLFSNSTLKPLILISLYVAALTIIGINNYAQDDTWRHLAIGEYILRNGIPIHEPFAIAPAVPGFIDYSWLSCIAYYLIYVFGGEPALIISSSLFFSVTLFILSYRKKIDFNWFFVSFCIGTLVLCAIRWRISARPESISYVFLALFFRSLFFSKKMNQLFLLILTALWMNFHASAIVVPVFLVLRYLSTLNSKKKIISNDLTSIVISVIGCLLTPWGVNLFISSFEQGYHPLNKFIYEYQPLILSAWLPLKAPLLAFLLLTALPLFKWSSDKNKISILLYYSICFYMALSYARGLPYAYFVLLPYSVLTLCTLVDSKSRTLNLPKIAAVVAMCFAALSFSVTNYYGLNYPTYASMRASQLLKSSPVKGNILNDFAFGGYLMWLGKSDYKLFIDNRSPVYATTTFPEYLNLSSPGMCESVLSKYNFEAILMPPPALCYTAADKLQDCWNLINCYKSKDWALVYISETALLFVKRKTEYLSFIQQHEYNYVDPLPKTTRALSEHIKIALKTSSGSEKFATELQRALHLEPLDNKIHIIRNLYKELQLDPNKTISDQIIEIK